MAGKIVWLLYFPANLNTVENKRRPYRFCDREGGELSRNPFLKRCFLVSISLLREKREEVGRWKWGPPNKENEETLPCLTASPSEETK